jgi:hypothetical protein
VFIKWPAKQQSPKVVYKTLSINEVVLGILSNAASEIRAAKGESEKNYEVLQRSSMIVC